MSIVLGLISLLGQTAEAAPVQVGGYMRVMTRPDLQGGNGTLGYWNLYGRLLNERGYTMLDTRIQLQEADSFGDPWSSVHFRAEGGSIANTDAGNGNLSNFRLSQVYLLSGNNIPNLVWQLGTLESYFGDLGLYDMRPAMVFTDTVGISGRYQTERSELLIGVGDAGYAKYGAEYNTVWTSGFTLRHRPIDQLEFGIGGQGYLELGTPGNRNAPYTTPEMDYEDWLRGEVVEQFDAENPFDILEFPIPELQNSSSYTAIGYVGFGGFGPVIWNNFYATYRTLHPEKYTTEYFEGQEFKLYTTDLTDERDALLIGNEMQLRIVPNKWDIAWGLLYGRHQDGDNDIAPSDHDRTYASTVLRSQWYIKPEFHFLIESSIAQEVSHNGRAYREHADSIFANTNGVADARGFEYGDTDTRITWQGKTGVVLNPNGVGIFNRPSLRVLYGSQYSNQNNAFGNAFVESLDQYNNFGNREQHWHHVVAVETESWF